ncbi:MAG: CpsD/CapB family tyrosine-protein kinase [Candidatus Zixiibacteriota bacterium]
MASNGRGDGNIIENFAGESATGTEFRRLLHNMLNHKSLPKDGKSFLITSSTTGEGKTTISSNLAITAAQYKLKKTLLIDADLRRPTVHRLFGFDRSPGLSDILENGLKVEDAFRPTNLENLWVMASGSPFPNPTGLFDTPRIPEVIAATKFYFDLIIIDCAPIIPVSDPLILGRDVDGLLMVVKAGETPKEVCKRACDLVLEAGANLLGVALNNVKEALPYYFNYRYYGYHYASKK